MTLSTLYIRPSMKYDLDIDELIREVHYRPAIWNKNCVGYTDRRLKARMWDEVCENIIDNWSKLKNLQKNTISNEVQKKWRNVKDAFNKEQKKLTGGQDIAKKKQYVHYKALSFLCNTEHYTSQSAVSLDDSDNESDNTSVDQENTSSSFTRKRPRNKHPNEDENLVQVKREKFHLDEENSNSEHNKQNTHNNDDNLLEVELDKPDFPEENSEFVHKKAQNKDDYPDRHFVEIKCDDWDNEVNSQIVCKKDQDKHFVHVRPDVKVYDEDICFSEMIVPMLRKLNDDQKHYAKIEIMNILHKAKRFHASCSFETQTEHFSSEDNREGE